MKKRCLVAGLLAFVMIFSGCGGSKTSNTLEETSSIYETVSSETVSSEVTDWGWLATEGAELAEEFIKASNGSFARVSSVKAGVNHIDTIVVSSNVLDRSASVDGKFYWNLKGHFYGKDEYGHTDGVYDFEITVYSEGIPTSSDYKSFDTVGSSWVIKEAK